MAKQPPNHLLDVRHAHAVHRTVDALFQSFPSLQLALFVLLLRQLIACRRGGFSRIGQSAALDVWGDVRPNGGHCGGVGGRGKGFGVRCAMVRVKMNSRRPRQLREGRFKKKIGVTRVVLEVDSEREVVILDLGELKIK